MRRKPYSDIGLRRKLCAHCGEKKATFQWALQVCANDRRKIHVPVCIECDIEFNRQSLAFVRHPETDALINRYAIWARNQR